MSRQAHINPLGPALLNVLPVPLGIGYVYLSTRGVAVPNIFRKIVLILAGIIGSGVTLAILGIIALTRWGIFGVTPTWFNVVGVSVAALPWVVSGLVEARDAWRLARSYSSAVGG